MQVMVVRRRPAREWGLAWSFCTCLAGDDAVPQDDLVDVVVRCHVLSLHIQEYLLGVPAEYAGEVGLQVERDHSLLSIKHAQLHTHSHAQRVSTCTCSLVFRYGTNFLTSARDMDIFGSALWKRSGVAKGAG